VEHRTSEWNPEPLSETKNLRVEPRTFELNPGALYQLRMIPKIVLDLSWQSVVIQ